MYYRNPCSPSYCSPYNVCRAVLLGINDDYFRMCMVAIFLLGKALNYRTSLVFISYLFCNQLDVHVFIWQKMTCCIIIFLQGQDYKDHYQVGHK